MIPTSLYIHMPWCIRKCPYCDFNSHESSGLLPEDAYVKALIADFKNDLSHYTPDKIHSIFIGGGTPSLLSANAYRLLFEQLQDLVSFSPNLEITMEANPQTLDKQRFSAYRELGINRLSLGVQSFNDIHLRSLGRVHDANQASLAIMHAREVGFDNINIDLMHGLPNQTIQSGLDDVLKALSYHPEHLSWYQLTLEPNTVFYKNPPTLPDDDHCFELEEAGLKLLTKAGYQRYEISAFCRPLKPSQHNLNYWQFGDYYGIGAGAHGKLTQSMTNIVRTRKKRQPKDYLNGESHFLVEKKQLTPAELIFEFMLNTTRLNLPIAYSLFSERTGLSANLLNPLLKKASEKKLIKLNESFWEVTTLGRRFTNNLQALFLP